VRVCFFLFVFLIFSALIYIFYLQSSSGTKEKPESTESSQTIPSLDKKTNIKTYETISERLKGEEHQVASFSSTPSMDTDTSYAYYAPQEKTLYVVDLVSKKSRKIVSLDLFEKIGSIKNLSLSPNGKFLSYQTYVSGNNESTDKAILYLLDLPKGLLYKLYEPNDPEYPNSLPSESGIQWSKESDRLVYDIPHSASLGIRKDVAMLHNLKDGIKTEIVNGKESFSDIKYGDGQEILYSTGRKIIRYADGQKSTLVEFEDTDISSFDINHSGEIIFKGTEGIYFYNPISKEHKKILNQLGDIVIVKWSPDGTKISIYGASGEGSSAYIVDKNGNRIDQLSYSEISEYIISENARLYAVFYKWNRWLSSENILLAVTSHYSKPMGEPSKETLFIYSLSNYSLEKIFQMNNE